MTEKEFEQIKDHIKSCREDLEAAHLLASKAATRAKMGLALVDSLESIINAMRWGRPEPDSIVVSDSNIEIDYHWLAV